MDFFISYLMGMMVGAREIIDLACLIGVKPRDAPHSARCAWDSLIVAHHLDVFR